MYSTQEVKVTEKDQTEKLIELKPKLELPDADHSSEFSLLRTSFVPVSRLFLKSIIDFGWKIKFNPKCNKIFTKLIPLHFVPGRQTVTG